MRERIEVHDHAKVRWSGGHFELVKCSVFTTGYRWDCLGRPPAHIWSGSTLGRVLGDLPSILLLLLCLLWVGIKWYPEGHLVFSHQFDILFSSPFLFYASVVFCSVSFFVSVPPFASVLSHMFLGACRVSRPHPFLILACLPIRI